MKKYFYSFYLLVFTSTFSFAQTQKFNYTIAPWFNNKKAAVSLTFDDGIKGQFTIAVPLLNEHGLKGTFFVTTKILTGQLGDWQLVKAAAAAGHEIANHSLTHPHFDSIAADNISEELMRSNALIEENIAPQKSLTHAYPFGVGGQETIQEQAARTVVKKYFIGARATRNQALSYNKYNFAVTNDDYFKVNSDVITDPASMAGFNSHIDETIAAGGWYVPTYHGIEDGWLIVPKNIFEKHLEYLQKQKIFLWIAPFADVLKYHKERNCATLKALSENKHSLIVQVADTLNNDAVWNQPLTIHLKTAGRKIKSIHQAGSNILFTFLAGEIIFNAVPGKNKIIITKK